MSAYEYLVSKQVLWAHRREIRLGSQFRNASDGDLRERGRRVFVYDLEDNLFEPLSSEARCAFEDGDGGELYADKPGEGNMYALQSSSAAACNLFHYWHRRDESAPIANALGLPSPGASGLRFEARYPIIEDDRRFPRPPNLDAEIAYGRGRLSVAAIECKFCEPYGRRHGGLSPQYLELREKWEELPNLYAIARTISPNDGRFRHVHAAQLIKHILGLTTAHVPSRFRLLYLWYEAVGSEAQRHRVEIKEFSEAANSDGIDLRELTYQDVILRLARIRDVHSEYVDYMAERYL
jgi:Restriction Endonuclease associating with ARP